MRREHYLSRKISIECPTKPLQITGGLAPVDSSYVNKSITRSSRYIKRASMKCCNRPLMIFTGWQYHTHTTRISHSRSLGRFQISTIPVCIYVHWHFVAAIGANFNEITATYEPSLYPVTTGWVITCVVYIAKRVASSIFLRGVAITQHPRSRE